MKRIISLVLVVVMAFGFGMTNAKAENLVDEGGNDQHRAKHYTYDGAQVDEAFQKNQVKDLYNAQKILVPSNMNKVKITETEDGIKFSGKRANLQAGRIDINKQFRFGDNYVGRFSIEATRAVAKPITIKFYIDADINPFCSIAIGREGRIDPVREIEKQEQSRVVMEEVITGHHSLSFSFETDCEEAEVTFKTFEFVQSALPVVSFDIDEDEGTVDEMNTSKNHSAECHGNMNINVPAGYTNEYSNNLVSASYPMEYIRGRGNSTWMVDKKPYKVKLAKKNGLLGMPANKHWVLLANVYDNSKIRNKMTYELGRRMNMPFTPKSVPVDVVMNGEYYGLYYLSEQIRVGENRVDIPDLTETKTELTDDEITGGYLLSAEDDETNPNRFLTNKKKPFFIESPAAEDWQNAETTFDEVKGYIQGYVNKCEEAMYNDDYKADDGTPYTDLIDVDSMISYYLFQEFSQNGDAYANGSTYFYKDRNGKLCFGPLWDFDYVAWAGSDYEEAPIYQFQNQFEVWNGRMLRNPDCFARLKELYAEMKAELQDMISDGGYIDSLYDYLGTSMYYDIEKNGFYEHNGDAEEPYVYSFEKESQRLKDWISGKIDFVDENIDSLQPTPISIVFEVDGQVVSEQQILKGDSVEVPADPEKPGHTFLGWYYDSDGIEEELNPNMDFDEDMTIYAKFASDKDVVPVTDIVLRTDDVYEKISEGAYSINYTVNPGSATFKECEITSSNPEVATVNVDYVGSFVDLKGVGDTTITLTSHNGIKKSFVLHVMPEDYPVEIEDVEFGDGPIKLKVGESKVIDFKNVPEESPVCTDIEFLVGDMGVAEMSDFGIITGNKIGKTFMLAQYDETRKLIEVIVEGDTPTPPTPPAPTVKKDELTLYGEFLKADKSAKYYSVIMPTNGGKPLLVVANKVAKKKYAKAATVYTVHNNKVVKVGNIKGKKGYLKYQNGQIVAKFGKNSVAYYKVSKACFTGAKYTKKKKKYYRYKLNCTKFIKKKKISKKKGKKYLKAKGTKSIVFTAK